MDISKIILHALSGTTGAALIGSTYFGLWGGIIGSLFAALFMGYGEYNIQKKLKSKKS